MKGFVTRNTYVQYESPFSSGKKVMAKSKVFQKKVKLQGQGHEVKNYGTMWKALSQEIHMCNMKSLSLLIRKLCPRLMLFRRRSNFKVKVTRSKFIVPYGRSYHEIHMCNMKALSLLVRKLWPRLKFFRKRSNFKVKVTRYKIIVPCKRYCQKEYICAIWKTYLFLQDGYGQG